MVKWRWNIILWNKLWKENKAKIYKYNVKENKEEVYVDNIEGICTYFMPNGDNVLLLSSQGDKFNLSYYNKKTIASKNKWRSKPNI